MTTTTTTEDKSIGIRLKGDQARQLEELAGKTGLATSDIVRQALREFMPKALETGSVTISLKDSPL